MLLMQKKPTLFILMDHDSSNIDTISMESSILYFKELPVKTSMIGCIFVPDFFKSILFNSVNPDEMSPHAAFYLGLHWVNPGITLCIPKIPKRVRWQTV